MSEAPSLSKRGIKTLKRDSRIEILELVRANLFDSATNANGIVDLGSSMNGLVRDITNDYVAQTYKWNPTSTSTYFPTTGSEALRESMANFMNRHFDPSYKILQKHIVAMNSAATLINMLMYTLLDEGEGVMMPTPGYTFLQNAAETRNFVRSVFANTESLEDQFISRCASGFVAALESSVATAETQGVRVKAVLLCNPHNPVGKCYEPGVLRAIMEFCSRKNLHLVIDEIYALSAFGAPFNSALSIDHLGCENLHVVYGVSKDWGFHGLRLGFMVSRNESVLSIMARLGQLHRTSRMSDDFFTTFLNDKDFIDNVYIPTLRGRLARGHANTTARLREIKIPYTPATAGLSLWVDLSGWLQYIPPSKTGGTKEYQLAR
ncbi:pyridoxal phosphate-dependent transferase [Aspergillus floccosus]